MAPLELLIVVVAITIAAHAWQYLMRYPQWSMLRKLARRWGMNFVSFDRFRLADRVREVFPVPGAADLRVVDVMYGLEEDRHRYLFTVHYTVGVLRGKRRQRRVVGMVEPRETGSPRPAEILIARPHKEVVNQYREMAVSMGMAAEMPA
mgnify:CR=1 FL=1